MYSPSIQKLIDQFSKLPTVGPRTAARFVFYLLKLDQGENNFLADSISDLKKKVKYCPLCFKPFEPFDAAQDKSDLCEICSSTKRNKDLLCIVEKETDLETIENTKKYQGLYFILGGTISKLRQEDIEKLRIKELQTRIKGVKEAIIATNTTSEGESTALYLERLLGPMNIKTTRLGRGLPAGGELEYADEETLSSAFDNRK